MCFFTGQGWFLTSLRAACNLVKRSSIGFWPGQKNFVLRFAVFESIYASRSTVFFARFRSDSPSRLQILAGTFFLIMFMTAVKSMTRFIFNFERFAYGIGNSPPPFHHGDDIGIIEAVKPRPHIYASSFLASSAKAFVHTFVIKLSRCYVAWVDGHRPALISLASTIASSSAFAKSAQQNPF